MRITLVLIAVLLVACSSSVTPVVPTGKSPEMSGGVELTKLGLYQAQKSVVLLRMIRNGKPSGHLCTASLIGTNTVLTAAHCLEGLSFPGNEGINIVFGVNSVATDSPNVRVSDYAIHPKYRADQHLFTYKFAKSGEEVTVTHMRTYDLAVLYFKGQLPDGFAPAQISTDSSENLTGQLVAAYGAGVRGSMFDAKSNADIIRTFPGQLSRGEFVIRESIYSGVDFYMIEGKSKERICGGDSGGPQFLLSAKNPTIIGVNSARFSEKLHAEKESCGQASLATKVSTSSTWILETKERFESKN